MSLNALHLPAPICAVVFGAFGRLGVASEDGTVRLYDTPYNKVSKAVRTAASEISSLVFISKAELDRELWAACGQHVLCFSLDAPNMILERKDASFDIRLTNEDEDMLNQIAINGTHLAYTLDSGVLCSNISFIPERPREIVSGGYDSALLHFDFHLRSLLSSFQISGPTEPSAQVSLSPPFVLSLSVSHTGLIACGLADGRIWLGSGGEKVSSNDEISGGRKKKRRKWEGLREADGHYHKIAEGPIVAVLFASPSLLLSLTLLGTFTLHNVENGQVQGTARTVESPGLRKANAMDVHGSSVAIGGISSDNKGILLVQPLQGAESQ